MTIIRSEWVQGLKCKRLSVLRDTHTHAFILRIKMRSKIFQTFILRGSQRRLSLDFLCHKLSTHDFFRAHLDCFSHWQYRVYAVREHANVSVSVSVCLFICLFFFFYHLCDTTVICWCWRLSSRFITYTRHTGHLSWICAVAEVKKDIYIRTRIRSLSFSFSFCAKPLNRPKSPKDICIYLYLYG